MWRQRWTSIVVVIFMTVFFTCGWARFGLAEDSSTKPARQGADTGNLGKKWSNVSAIYADDTSYAKASKISANGGVSDYLKATKFGFSIPAGATVKGITVSVVKCADGTATRNVVDNRVYLLKAGSIVGNNRADTASPWGSGAPPAGLRTATYGSSTDLWGTNWTAADINNSNFGVVLSAKNTTTSSRNAWVDYIQIKVTYTVATNPSVIINQASTQEDPTYGTVINFTAVFSESVADFSNGDVTLAGTAGAATAAVTGSGSTYNIAVSDMSNPGTVIASIAAGVAHSSSGNGNLASTSTDNLVTVASYRVDFAAGTHGSLIGTTSFSDILAGTDWRSAVTVPVPEADAGYTFADWSPSLPESVTASATYTALWEANSYSVTLNGNGGDDPSPATRTITYGETYGTLPTTDRMGYTFSGWFTLATGGIEVMDNTIVSTASDHTLYAHWTADSQNVIYHPNGGAGNMDPTVAETGAQVSLSRNSFSNEGYTFAGWVLSLSTTIPDYGDGASVLMPVGGLNLYALWDADSQAISYHPNGGEGTMPDSEGDTGTSVVLSSNGFTRSGFSFQGWSTDAAGTEVQYSDGTSLTMPTGGLDLYAVWDAETSGLEAFVTRFYQECLGREPDQAGLEYWAGKLESGQKSGADVAYGFVFSNEFLNANVSNDDFLQVLYYAFFDREPDTVGYNYWFGKLGSGTSRLQVLAGFVNANEFAALCGAYGIIPGTITLP